jgi:hypothetical protein
MDATTKSENRGEGGTRTKSAVLNHRFIWPEDYLMRKLA